MAIKEIFKDVPSYEGLYQVSNLGNVKRLYKSVKERILKPTIHSDGYFVVNLSKQSKTKSLKVHQLVAMSFLNHKRQGMKLVINHINFKRLDNRLENLEIVTSRENSNKKHLKSTSKYTGVSSFQGKWKSTIGINGKTIYLGLFDNEINAHNAYQKRLLCL